MSARLKSADLLRAAALTLVIAVTWAVVQNRLNANNWHIPLFLASDGLSLLAGEKAAAEGNLLLVLPKFNPHFGAPYVANWNDYPLTEEPLIVSLGLVARVIGLFPASNALVLAAHVLAALSFFVTCRVLGCRWQWAFLGSMAFALSRYAFQRGLPHLGLTYYWHIPLCLLVCIWCGSRRGLEPRGKRFWIAIGIALITGVQNPYYTNIFLQFLFFAGLAQAIRRQTWKVILTPLLIGAASVAAFLLMNLDTLSYQAKHGKNTEAGARTYQGVELYALKPLDLLIPPPDHRLAAARKIAWNYIYDEAKKVYVRGELFSQYLGLTGMVALLWLAVVTVYRLSLSTCCAPPAQAWQVFWVILYSVIGGINGLLGQVGVSLFRCTNRYSIYILACVLIFAVRQLSRLTRSWRPVAVTGLAAGWSILLLWDQLPPVKAQSSVDQVAGAVASDRQFTVALEKALPRGAMVFQLPAMRFPESWPIAQMGDYEHFRPYLYSRELRYSYGDHKGRGRDDWQFAVERLPAVEMINSLERIGFAAIYINRNGYVDRGAALLQNLNEAGRTRIIESPAHDLAAVLLTPSATPVLPERPPEFKSGWYSEEGNNQGDSWHCSNGNAEVVLHNSSTAPRKVRVEFQLASHSARTVELWAGNRLLYASPMLNANRISHSMTLDLSPGATTLHLKTQPPVTFPGNPDTRVLGFILYNLRVTSASD